jgi:phytanoyl-CoA hydroxylase
MLSDQHVAEFNRNGCLVGGRLISDAEVEELCAELDRIITAHQSGTFKAGDPQPVMIGNLGGGGDGGQVVWQIVNIWEASPAFRRLLYLKPIVEGLHQQPSSVARSDSVQAAEARRHQ